MPPTTRQSPPPRKENRAWTIRVLFSGRTVTDPRPHLLPLGEMAIGRATTGPYDLTYDDSAMSRRHATIERSATSVQFHDHSRNGSLVNGTKAHDIALEDGDLICCGNTFAVIRFEPISPDDAHVEGLLGVSALARKVRAAVAEVAATDTTVVFQGETGTGKAVAARAVHELSGRDGVWIQLNCAAIPESMAESTLFGHTKGAFAGANKDQKGYFSDADGGTLFIEEIADLELELQAKLLDALDHAEATPVGGTRPVRFDTRLVTASNKDLSAEVSADRFRADLHARLAAVVIWIPPLRERIEDMLGVLVDRLGEHPPLSPDLVAALLEYHWPDNFRELDRIAIDLSVRGAGYEELVVELVQGALQSAHMRPAKTAPSHQPPPRRPAPPTRDELEDLLVAHRGSVAPLVRELGRSAKQVYRWLAEHGLDPETFRSG